MASRPGSVSVRRVAVARVGAWLGGAAAALSLAACATAPPPSTMSRLADGRPRAFNRPYQVRGRWYTPVDQPGYDKVGLASWYSYESPSRTTADGERFDIRIPHRRPQPPCRSRAGWR